MALFSEGLESEMAGKRAGEREGENAKEAILLRHRVRGTLASDIFITTSAEQSEVVKTSPRSM